MPTKIWNFIKELPSMLWELIKDVLNGILSILEFIWDTLKNIPSFIWNLFKTSIESIVNVVLNIFDWLGNFFEFLLDFFKRIFVPSDNFFKDNFVKIRDSLNGTFGVDLGVIEDLKNSSGGRSSSNSYIYSFTVMGTSVVLDFSFITRFRGLSQIIAGGLSTIFVCWYNYKKVYHLIRGTSPIEGSGGGAPPQPTQISFFD